MQTQTKQILGSLIPIGLLVLLVWIAVTSSNKIDQRNEQQCVAAFSITKTAHDSLVYLISNTECARFMYEDKK